MTTRQQFFERIKVMSRDLVNGKKFARNRPRRHEAEMRPLSATAPPAFARADLSWSMNQGGGWDVEYTRSNLG